MDVAIDTGGTFTDCLGRRTDGTLVHCKVPSTPDDPSRAILAGLAHLQGLADGEAITHITHGSTVATNALLEGQGGNVFLIVPKGFEDLLELARQQRPELYTLFPVLPYPALTRSRIVGIPARLAVDGTWIEKWNDEDLASFVAMVVESGNCDAIGICLLHGYRYPEAEHALATALRTAGLPSTIQIALASDLSREAGEYERATTTAINARLLQPVGSYLLALNGAIGEHFPDATLHIVLSNGDAVPPHEAARMPVRMLLSGPAGGVNLGWQIAQLIKQPVITLDIGGTSTDVACIPESPLVREEGVVGGFPIRTPMLDIETLGAGGGSLLWLDSGGALQVGPRSAGAVPGPACYGQGGTFATLTDAHVYVGNLHEDLALPGNIQLSGALAAQALAPLAAKSGLSMEALAQGAIAIANQRIAKAIRAISSQRGIPPESCALVVMGGAGGMHGAEVATLLGIRTLVIPPLAGLGSALGLSGSSPAVAAGVALASSDPAQDLEAIVTLLRGRCQATSGSTHLAETEEEQTAWMRFVGQDRALPICLEPQETLETRFRAVSESRYGSALANTPVELVRLRVRLVAPRTPWLPLIEKRLPDLDPGVKWILSTEHSTTILPVHAARDLRFPTMYVMQLPQSPHGQLSTAMDAVGLTLANDLFSSIAEEMALVLEHLGHSSNITDRRDLSTALFDGEGRLLAQGAHIPVHLGSMEASVAAARAAFDLEPGDTVILNSPFAGGTHLPDITLVSCLSLGDLGNAYVASRAHHADIGGTAPGSMPLTANADDEGILIPPTVLERAGVIEQAIIDSIKQASRQPEERAGDLAAQLASNRQGALAFQRLVARMPADWYREASSALLHYAASMVQLSWKSWELGVSQATVVLESDGLGEEDIEITVTAALAATDYGGRHLIFDFEGTSEPVEGPVNCPRAVVNAAVSFVIRCLAPEGTPANAGLLRDVTLRIPHPSLLDAEYPSATAAGNVETSQKLVAVLQKALTKLVPGGLPRPSQGTMNNVLVGGLRVDGTPYTYYETIAGGCGAGLQGEGASAVHSHMTNSRNTPIEILETRFPFVIESYTLRRESGGWPKSEQGYFGGLGVQRAYRFLTHAILTLIADWPRHNDKLGPKPGVAYLLHPDDSLEPLESKCTRALTAGTILLLATPGGWAWDPPAVDPAVPAE